MVHPVAERLDTLMVVLLAFIKDMCHVNSEHRVFTHTHQTYDKTVLTLLTFSLALYSLSLWQVVWMWSGLRICTRTWWVCLINLSYLHTPPVTSNTPSSTSAASDWSVLATVCIRAAL